MPLLRPAPLPSPAAPPGPAGRPWLLRAAAVFAVLSLAAYLTLALTRAEEMWWMGDLKVYQAGGDAVLAGGGGLYDAQVGAAKLPFTYTPWAALTFVPLAWIPLGLLKGLALAGNLVLLFLCALWSWSMAGRTERRIRLALALATFAVLLWTDPVQETLRFGQVNLLLLALVLFDLAKASGKNYQGVGIGLAAALKLIPLIFVGYLFLTRRYRAAFTALGTFAGTLALAFALLPRESARYWSGLFLDNTRIGLVPFPGNQSLRGALARLAHAEAPSSVLWLLLAAAVGCLGLATAVVLHRQGDDLAGVAVCALAGLLVSPISWTHHWVWIVPGFVAAAAYAARGRHRWPLPAAMLLLMAAPPAQRGGLGEAVPSGVVWQAPYARGREMALHGFQQVTGSAYTLGALALLAGVSVAVLWPPLRQAANRHSRGGGPGVGQKSLSLSSSTPRRAS